MSHHARRKASFLTQPALKLVKMRSTLLAARLLPGASHRWCTGLQSECPSPLRWQNVRRHSSMSAPTTQLSEFAQRQLAENIVDFAAGQVSCFESPAWHTVPQPCTFQGSYVDGKALACPSHCCGNHSCTLSTPCQCSQDLTCFHYNT